MTKEEQIEALKEAKKWEMEQQNKVSNATSKMIMMPILIVVVAISENLDTKGRNTWTLW